MIIRNRIIERARSIARRNPIDPPLMDGTDILAAIAIALVLAAIAVGAGFFAGGTP